MTGEQEWKFVRGPNFGLFEVEATLLLWEANELDQNILVHILSRDRLRCSCLRREWIFKPEKIKLQVNSIYLDLLISLGVERNEIENRPRTKVGFRPNNFRAYSNLRKTIPRGNNENEISSLLIFPMSASRLISSKHSDMGIFHLDF